ncbi:hypothetical protein ACVXHA_24920 [Escherichia coli]
MLRLSPEHEEKLSAAVLMTSVFIRTEIPFMLQSGFRRRTGGAISRDAAKCSMINPSPCRRWMSEQDKQPPYMPISEENPCLGWRRDSHYAQSAGNILDPGAGDAAC